LNLADVNPALTVTTPPPIVNLLTSNEQSLPLLT
jgi:hypothetical protein